MVFKVYIGGLPAGTTEAEVEREFTKFGTLATVWVARKPPGFAFVEYSDSRDADDAVRQLDGYNGWRVEHSRAGARRERPIGVGYGDRGGYSRDNSPPPRRRRSPSYDRARRRSPSYDRARRRSPSYDRARRRSPSYDRARRRSPSPYGLVDKRRRRSPSPPPRRSRRSPSPRRRRRSPSPVRRTSSRRRDRSESPAPRKSLSPVRSGSGRSE